VRLDRRTCVKNIVRCAWATNDLSIPYHDREWGVPQHDDRVLFEFLILEGAQAGFELDTILRKRENYPRSVWPVRPEENRPLRPREKPANCCATRALSATLESASAIRNAKAFLAVQEEFGSFDAYIWQFVGGRALQNHRRLVRTLPARTPQSDAMSKDLKKRGFNFVGSTICYAFMQATGMVNDHRGRVLPLFRQTSDKT